MLTLPQKIDSFTLTRCIGSDGITESFAAILDEPAGKPVIARQLRPWIHRDFAKLTATEARIRDLLDFDHPLLVTWSNLSVHEDKRWIIELPSSGTSLATIFSQARAQKKQLPGTVFLHLATQICNAVEALHGRTGRTTGLENVLHTKISPHAVMVLADGRIQLGDFGIQYSPWVASTAGVAVDPEDLQASKAGISYLSPEQTWPDQTLTPASDVFAIGALLYEMLTLEPLFQGDSPELLFEKIREFDITSSLSQIGERIPGLDKVLSRALSINPRQRYRRAFVMREDLRSLMAGFSFTNLQAEVSKTLAPFFNDRTKEELAPMLIGWSSDGSDDTAALIRRAQGEVEPPSVLKKEFPLVQSSGDNTTERRSIPPTPLREPPTEWIKRTPKPAEPIPVPSVTRIPSSELKTAPPPPPLSVKPTRYTESARIAPVPAANEPQALAPTPQESNSSRWMIIGISAGVFALITVCGGGGVAWWLQSTPDQISTPPVAMKPSTPDLAIKPSVSPETQPAEPVVDLAEPAVDSNSVLPVEIEPIQEELEVEPVISTPSNRVSPSKPVPDRVEPRRKEPSTKSTVVQLQNFEEKQIVKPAAYEPVPNEQQMPLQEPVTPLSAFSERAYQGKLDTAERTVLETIRKENVDYMRSRLLLYEDAKARKDNSARQKYLEEAMSMPEGQYNPTLLVEQGLVAIEQRQWKTALSKADLAERYWHRLPSDLVFSRKTLIYEIQATAWEGIFYESEGSDLNALHSAIQVWEKYQHHVALRRSDLSSYAEGELAKLHDARKRLE